MINPKKSDIPAKQIDNTTPVTIANIKQGIFDGFEANDFQPAGTNMTLERVSYYQQDWVIVQATLTDEPHDSEARSMMYVLKRVDDGKVELVAFSGDGFSKNSFPEDTPEGLIEEVVERW
ncbi:hypothetical protein B7Y94_04665 [Candidatus Saccharibacteria bacterium 32-49-12]|nr:MAG: hypothetical protein B7Y94_04665 [Candidatus Saccharibacteria bacterium 32-49-12]